MMGVRYGHDVTNFILLACVAVLALAAIVIAVLGLAGRLSPALKRELWLRLGAWMVLLPAMLIPVMAGRMWLIAAVTLLGIACLREFDRGTGLFREPVMAAGVAAGIFLVNFASLDHWYNLFVALFPLTVVGLAALSIPLDRPAGYIQRTGLAIFAFALFGTGLGHLGFMGNDRFYRPLVLLILTAVALNDVLAFTCGKLIGGRKLLPATSPNKTLSGALGAVCGLTPIVAVIGWFIFADTPMGSWPHLVALGVLISVAGQAGDLMLSSIKRDLGIKDMGTLIPGHGGILDRFNSLLLVAPAVFHYVNYVAGIGLDQPSRLITG